MAGIKQATVTLSAKDIDFLSRVVQTEVDHRLSRTDPKEYGRQIKGVTDTILNRVASGYYPNTVEGVVNQRRQFSAINGPKTYVDSNGIRRSTGAVGSVDKAEKASALVRGIVTDWAAQRASGVPSSIGDHLNYANPKASSANNLDWIQEMIDAPGAQIFGHHGRQHVHGTPKAEKNRKIETDVAIDGFNPPNMYRPFAPPTPNPRPQNQAVPVVPVEREALPSIPEIQQQQRLANPIPRARPIFQVTPPTPRGKPQASISPAALRTVTKGIGALSWDTPNDLLTAFSKSREAIGVPTGEGATPFVRPSAPVMASAAPIVSKQAGKAANQAQDRINNVWGRVPQEKTPLVSQVGGVPAIRPGYDPSTSRSVNAQSRIDRTFAQIPTQKTIYGGGDAQRAKSIAGYQQYGATRAAATPQVQPQTRTVKTVEYRPSKVEIAPTGKANTGGMTLDNVGEFAYGPTSMNVSQMNTNAFGQTPTPVPTPKAKPQYQTVMRPVVTYAQVPIPTPKPQAGPALAQPQSIFGRIFSPAGVAGSLAGNMVAGPIGGVVGNLAARGVSNAVKRNPTFGNRGRTRSFSTAPGSGGPYAGQTWRNTSTGGTRVFNPSTRQYEDIGGSNAGNRSSSQSTGGGGCFITTAAVDVMGEQDHGDTLTTLRWFRDNVMRRRPDWAKDIDAYYQIAPKIVAMLNSDHATYRRLYETVLFPSAIAVKRGAYDQAYSLYKNMVLELMRALNGDQSYSGA